LLKEENPHPSPPPSETASDRGGSATPSPVRGSTNADENTTAEQQTGEGWEGGRLFAARHAAYYRRFAKEQNWRKVEHFFDQIDWGWQWVQANAPEQIIDYQFAVSDFLRTRGREFERIRWMQVALQAARNLNDRKREGTLLNNLGYAHNALGQNDKALDTYQQALAIYREVGDHLGEGTTLNNIGPIYKAHGQLDEALDTYQQALAIRREVGDRSGEGTTLNNIGLIYNVRGQLDEALDTYQQALAIRREVGDRLG
jgi:tetratricopeptide (TPR) repeat protein